MARQPAAAKPPKTAKKKKGGARATPTFKERQINNLSKISKLAALVKKALGRTEVVATDELGYIEAATAMVTSKLAVLADDYAPSAATKRAITDGDHVMIVQERREAYAKFPSVDPSGVALVEDASFSKSQVVVRFSAGHTMPFNKKDLYIVPAPAPVANGATKQATATA
jgi:hypothetical protein